MQDRLRQRFNTYQDHQPRITFLGVLKLLQNKRVERSKQIKQIALIKQKRKERIEQKHKIIPSKLWESVHYYPEKYYQEQASQRLSHNDIKRKDKIERQMQSIFEVKQRVNSEAKASVQQESHSKQLNKYKTNKIPHLRLHFRKDELNSQSLMAVAVPLHLQHIHSKSKVVNRKAINLSKMHGKFSLQISQSKQFVSSPYSKDKINLRHVTSQT